MDTIKYLDHKIEACKYMYFFDVDGSVEGHLDDMTSALSEAIASDKYFRVDLSSFPVTQEENTETITVTVDNHSGLINNNWRVIAITGEDETIIYGAIYTQDVVEVQKIYGVKVIYSVMINGSTGAKTVIMRAPFETHVKNKERHPVFDLASNENSVTTISTSGHREHSEYKKDWLDPDFRISGDESWVSMTNAGPVCILNDNGWRVRPMTGGREFPITMPVTGVIYSFNVLEDGRGLVMTCDNGIYAWKLENDGGYFTPKKIIEGENTLIIPTFIDLCPCYVSIARLDKYAPVSYTVKYWTELFLETGVYGEKIDTTTIGRYSQDLTSSNRITSTVWVEPLSLENNTRTDASRRDNTSYYANIVKNGDDNADNQAVVPTVMMNYLSMHLARPEEEYNGLKLLYLNLRAAVLTYIDVVNKNRNISRITPMDCGLDIHTTDSKRLFLTYFGDLYRLKNSYGVSGMNYYENTDNGYFIYPLSELSKKERVSIKNGSERLVHLKYGIPLFRS